MIEEVKSWGFLIQRYFLSVCLYISFYIKRLGSLTAASSSGVGKDGSSVSINTRNGNLHQLNANDTDKNQSQTNSKVKLKPSSEIPGPKCLPVFGSLFEFNKFGPKNVFKLSVERHSKYGDIFREKLLSQELVFVASSDLLKQWMNQEGKLPESLTQQPATLFGECFPNLKRGIFFRNGEDWYQLRKLAHNILNRNASDFNSQGLFIAFEKFIEDYIKDLKEFVRNSEDGLVHDVEIRCYEIAVGALLTIMFGGDVDKLRRLTGTDYKTISRDAKEINEAHQKLLEFPTRLAKWLGMTAWTTYYTKLHSNLSTCLKFCQMSREEILKSPKEASMRSHGILYKTVEMGAPEKDVDSLLTDFAVDTKDPFSATLMFTTYTLGLYPEVQEKIYEEVCRVYPSNESITCDNSSQLEYTEAFFKEALRLYPVAPFTVRVARVNTVIGDYLITPGTVVMYSSYVAHRDPRYFSEPLKCLPERWMNNGSGHVCDINAYAPFGLKSRVCIGQQMTFSLFRPYIAHLVRNFKITSSKETEIEMRTVLYPDFKPFRFEIR